MIHDSRTGKNDGITGQFRQSVFGRLGGFLIQGVGW